jgi:site-specific DNA recombinase
MLGAAKRSEFDILLVDDLSRLARDQVESERVIRYLEFRSIRIVATADGYDSQTKTATRKIQRTVKGPVNEMRLDELRDQVHRGLTGQAIKGYWCGGRVYGYALRPILDQTRRDPYGQPERVGTKLEVDPEQAGIVREIYRRYADGASCRTIAKDLNNRGVPSAGSTWKRKVRRCSGWVNSAIRTILKNPLYTGRVRWNTGGYVRDPDNAKRVWRERPQDEWVEHCDESVRIISDELFQRAQERNRIRSNSDTRMKSGGRPKYLLSGLLHCGICNAHYILHDARSYACSGHKGGACDNHIRVRRDALESAILGPLRNEMLAPERVAQMAKEMQRDLLERMHKVKVRAAEQPQELQELDARIARLRNRLAAGDPDITPDELQAALDRAEYKRRELAEPRPTHVSESAKLLTILPNAAELYRRQITLGLDGAHPQIMLKARLAVRELLGQIRLEPGADGSLWADYEVQPAVLVRGAVSGFAG